MIIISVAFLVNLHLVKSAMLPVQILNDLNSFVNISASNESGSANLFCWKGLDTTLKFFFASSSFYINIGTSEYKAFFGENASQVEHQVKTGGGKFWNPELLWKSSKLRFNPFQDACYGILTPHPYELYLEFQAVNLVLVFLFLTSLSVFLLAPFLSRSTMIHYTTWVTLGICFSLVCLTFLLQKRFRQSFFSWVFLAYSMSFYLMSTTLYSLDNLLSPTILPWFGLYSVVTGVISWAVLYRIGPPSHPRTLSLMQWAIQGVSLILMIMSSYNTRASIMATILILLIYALPKSRIWTWTAKLREYFRQSKPVFLSEFELQHQTERETRLALEQLRRHCRENHREAWRIMSRLKNPGRFAEFVEGGRDVTEEEVEKHKKARSEEETSDSIDCDLSQDTTDSEPEYGHRFRCFLCNPSLLGHRFRCTTCVIEN